MCVAMIGTGYAGIVSRACFADLGHVVTFSDSDPGKFERLETDEIPVTEPRLQRVFTRDFCDSRLFATLEGAVAIKTARAARAARSATSRGRA